MLPALLALALAAPPPADDQLKVDQFGFLPGAPKHGLLTEPVTGYNSPDPYTPGATIEVRRWSDDSLAWSGPAVAWNGGAVHAQSGDRVWTVDFSALTETGAFYLFDPASGRGSGRFEIGPDAYRAVLDQALRSFFYQRCGQDKATSWTDPRWADPVCHMGAEQDSD